MTHAVHRIVACALACVAAPPVFAAETTWTGAAAAPFWDLPANWTAGPPAAATTHALLGGFDSTLRSGVFDVATVRGGGTLTMTGGELRVAGAGSLLGGLDFSGGALSGALRVRQLTWRGAGQGATSGLPRLTVDGPALLAGEMGRGPGGYFEPYGFASLLGETSWQDGESKIGVALLIGPEGVFRDHADSGDHALQRYLAFVNRGRYEKTGAATTTIPVGQGFVNSGTFVVREGAVRFGWDYGDFFSQWTNSGAFIVEGGSVRMQGYERGVQNVGTVDVRRGHLTLDGRGAGGSGIWNIAQGAGASVFSELVPYPAGSTGTLSGRWNVDGQLGFSGFGVQLTVPATTRISGRGGIGVENGANVRFDGPVDVGGLSVGPIVHVFIDPEHQGWAASMATITGHVRLQGGLVNEGFIEVLNGGRLTLAGSYNQSVWLLPEDRSGIPVGLRLDGTLEAAQVSLGNSEFGAGGPGSVVGRAQLLTAQLSFEDCVFQVDLLNGADDAMFDVVSTTGHATLGGTLLVNGHLSPIGTFRILSAQGGIDGRFAAVDARTAPAFRVEVLYGPGSVDLRVSAVPEPATAGLMALGVMGLVLVRRRAPFTSAGARPRCPRPGSRS